MRADIAAGVAVVAFALGVSPLAAQEAAPVEVTPYVAVGTAGVSPFGAAITWPVTRALGVEMDVGYRRGEGGLVALSSNASLLLSLPRVGATTPYLAAGLGLAQYGSPVLSADGPPAGTQSRMGFTVNAGGGFKMPMNETLDLRTDVRWSRRLGRDGAEQFRVAQGLSFDVKR